MRLFKNVLSVFLLGIITYFLVLSIFTGLKVQGYSYLFRATEPYDLVLKHALIIDGSGENKIFRGDIAIRNGFIAAIGYINAKKSPVFDAGGLTAIPSPVGIEKNKEAVEHLLSTVFPRYPAEEIFLFGSPYKGLSLAQAAGTEGIGTDEMHKRLIALGGADSKALVLAVKHKEDDCSSVELLARITGYRAEALGIEGRGLLRAGHQADLYLFKTLDYSEEDLMQLLEKGSVPKPIYMIEDGRFVTQ